VTTTQEIEAVRKAYDRFNMLHARTTALDEGDVQNIHLWMLAVTRAVVALGEDVVALGEDGE
jgi:hypothetical protein